MTDAHSEITSVEASDCITPPPKSQKGAMCRTFGIVLCLTVSVNESIIGREGTMTTECIISIVEDKNACKILVLELY